MSRAGSRLFVEAPELHRLLGPLHPYLQVSLRTACLRLGSGEASTAAQAVGCMPSPPGVCESFHRAVSKREAEEDNGQR